MEFLYNIETRIISQMSIINELGEAHLVRGFLSGRGLFGLDQPGLDLLTGLDLLVLGQSLPGLGPPKSCNDFVENNQLHLQQY